jgi:hypothetical protein
MNDADEITLSRNDVERIVKFLETDPSVQYFKLSKVNAGGIGYTLELQYPTEVNGYRGHHTVELVGVDEW